MAARLAFVHLPEPCLGLGYRCLYLHPVGDIQLEAEQRLAVGVKELGEAFHPPGGGGNLVGLGQRDEWPVQVGLTMPRCSDPILQPASTLIRFD